MASSSSSFGASHSNSKQHHVFLNFRGEDTRYNFTSHLYAALCGKKIHTFMDDEEIERGDNISPTLLSAIESSKICVIIFSQDYASSSWCLDELVKIIECSEKKKLVVIPVFYHIDASHVRHQRGTYGDAFAKHEDRFRDNLTKVNMWRTALHKAANLAGWVSEKNRSEAVVIKEIVEDILDKLKCMIPHVQKKGLVGISRHIAHVESMLCSGSADVHIIGIWGMGGIGKTTIADAVFTKVSYQYEGYYFAANVREKWGNRIKLRNEVLADVLGDQSINISTPTMSSTFAVERLKCKKVLVVLDDVSLSEQIEYLVGGRDWFGPGSRIIVTTRNKEVFNSGVDEVYQVTVLNSHEALKLFSLNAFQQDSPLIEYQHLSERAVGYAKGIPLALKVLGSHLRSKRPKEWVSALEKLKKYPKAEIYDVLRLSYEGLDPEEQNIFLDIACCLKGQTKSQITSILDACDFSTEIGMRSLEDKSLVTVSKNNTVQMHDLIQEMGRFVESEKKPGERKRLWDPKEIYDVFKHNRGIESIECVVLDMSQIKELTLSPQTFQRTHRLRVLIFYIPSSDTRRINVHISRGLNCMPDELSYFRWDCFPLKSLPPRFCAEKLVELDIKHSRIGKLWDGVQDLVNLKSLHLSGCKNLVELSDLSSALKLEKIHLDDCASLLNVPSYVLSLDSLLALNLRGCKQLCYIESEKQSKSLRWLNLSGCSRLVKYSVFSDEMNYLNLDRTAIEELPHNLDLLPKLNKLSLRGSNIEILPANIQHLSLLRALDVSNCRRLRSLPKLPLLLQDLNASNCISLETVSNLGITMLQDSFGKLNKRTLLRQIHEEEQMSIRHRDYLGRFEFHNCMNLDQIACRTVMEEALIRIQLAACLSSKIKAFYDPYCQSDDEVSENFDSENFLYVSRPFYSILLGNEVPNWFLHKETNSLVITIKFSSHRFLAFAFCLVLGASESNRKNNRRTGLMAGCRYYFKDKYGGTSMIRSSCSDAESDQVWLWYDQILDVADVSGNLSFKVSFVFFVRPSSSGFMVKQCGIRPLYAPFDTMQSSDEEVSRKSNMPYHEFEYINPMSYRLLRDYDHPPDGLGFPSKQQRISGCHDGHIMEPIPSTYCAENVVDIHLEHNHAVSVNFGLIGSGHQPRDLQCLAQMLLDDYCYFGKLVDNIDIFSSLGRLSLSDCNVESFPSRIANLSRLKELSITNCKSLRSLSNLPPSLRRLSLSDCNVESFPSRIANLSRLKELSITNCKSLRSLSNLPPSLERLSLSDCNVESFPSRIADLSRLKGLSITNCKSLRSLSKLPPSLLLLSVLGCTSLNTVEFPEEYVTVNFSDEKITRVIEVEKVSRIQVTDPRANVTSWTMFNTGPSPVIEIQVASNLDLLNVERRDCCTIEVTVKELV